MTAKPCKPPMHPLAIVVLMLMVGAVVFGCFYFGMLWWYFQTGDSLKWLMGIGLSCASIAMILIAWLTAPKK